jgi:hypothetical protein
MYLYCGDEHEVLVILETRHEADDNRWSEAMVMEFRSRGLPLEIGYVIGDEHVPAQGGICGRLNRRGMTLKRLRNLNFKLQISIRAFPTSLLLLNRLLILLLICYIILDASLYNFCHCAEVLKYFSW